MAGLLRDAGEHGWRHADVVKYIILASPKRRWLLNGGTAAGCRRASLEVADAVKYTILASPQWRWLLNGGTAAGCRRAWLEARRCCKIQYSCFSPNGGGS